MLIRLSGLQLADSTTGEILLYKVFPSQAKLRHEQGPTLEFCSDDR
jgi:hypothetical protein